MKRKLIILSVCLSALLVLLCGCSPEKQLNKTLNSINSNISNAKTFTQKLTVTDGGVTVYSLEKKVEVDGDNAAVTTVESKLSSGFTLQETTSTANSEKSEQLKLPVTLSIDTMIIYTLKDDVLTCVIGQENADGVFGAQNYKIAGDINVKCTLSNGKMQQLDCLFVTETGKDVTLTVTCAY